MKSLLEAVVVIVLFCFMPMIAVWVLISVAWVIENIGDLPIDERGLSQFAMGQEVVFQAGPFRVPRG